MLWRFMKNQENIFMLSFSINDEWDEICNENRSIRFDKSFSDDESG